MLNSFPSVRLCRYTLSDDDLKARNRRSKKKIPKGVEAKTQPCFTLLLMGKGSEQDPSYMTFLSSWKETTKMRKRLFL